MKVLWRHHSKEEATWETEENMRRRYPHLFEKPGIEFRRRNSLKEGRM